LKNQFSFRFSFWSSTLISLLANFPILDIGIKRMEHIPITGHPGPIPPQMSPANFGIEFTTQLIISFLFAFLLINFLNKVDSKFNIRTFKSWIVAARVLLLFSGFAITIYSVSLFWVDNGANIIGSVITRGLLIMAACLFLSSFIKLMINRQRLFAENEVLKNKNLNSQIEVLRNQLNPHFFFNALNTLSYLINEDKDKSQAYLGRLSLLLRSSMEVQKHQLIRLTEELELAEAYVYLLVMRFGENLRVKFQTEGAEQFMIPPMCLQLLLENAFKHNVISKDAPLYISVILDKEQSSVTVRNNRQLKTGTQGTGIGLQNLNERILLLTEKEIKIIENKEIFEVTVQLLHEWEQPAL